MHPAELKTITESLIFAAGDPVSLRRLSEVIGVTPAEVKPAISLLREEYQAADRGIVFAEVAGGYEYVILDCPPSLSLLTLNALTAADSVLIPIQCEYYALEGLGQLLNSIRKIQKHLNRNLKIEGILLTMYDKRLNLSRQIEVEAKQYFADKVYQTTIPRNVRLSEAPSFGSPIILYDILSSGAESYMNLAREVISNGSQESAGTGA